MKKKNFLLKNGAAMLEELIISFNGKCNLMRTFSAEEIKKSTDNFNWSRLLYCGCGYRILKLIANEVMSNHKNVLKLLGCCFETELPVLVYEFTVNGNLSDYFGKDDNEQLLFEIKLRIAIGVANAVAYLHHGLSKTFIHRDLGFVWHHN
ncbi:Tyrosine-protein kinase [Parasponia andersonii]|uniref:Tyrosine-protein kinase n=1 Tax=Parasponia andersonii TaxID=3476 RepID=A0A2P5DX07_PARAD|nr:Tyrosine-protein kinase [Parasponia andersonii]